MSVSRKRSNGKRSRARKSGGRSQQASRRSPPRQANIVTSRSSPALGTSKIPRRQSESSRSQEGRLAAKGRRRFTRVLGNSTWQGIAGIVGIAGLVATLIIWIYGINQEHSSLREQQEKSIAAVEISTTYQYDGADNWTMLSDISNNGPAVASTIYVNYSVVHTTCAETELQFAPGKRTKVEVRSIKNDLQCVDGSGFTGAKQLTDLPGLFLHPLADFSSSTSWGLVSGTAYTVHPMESIWIDFHFKVTPDLNQKLLKLLPKQVMPDTSSSAGRIAPFFSIFNRVDVAGDNVEVSADAVNLLDNLL